MSKLTPPELNKLLQDIKKKDKSKLSELEQLILFQDNELRKKKHIEKKTKESEELIRGIINSIPVRVFWKDLDLRYLGCNKIFAQDAGLSDPEELIGKDDFQMTWKDQAELYRNDDMQVIKSGNAQLNIEEPQTTPDGETIYLLTSKTPLKDSDGTVFGVLGTYMDITQVKKTEQNLLFEQHLLNSLMNNSPDAIYFKDIDSKFIRINATLAKLFGLSDPKEAIGKTDSDFFTSEHSSNALKDEQRIIETGIPTIYKEEKETWPDGKTTWAQTTKLPLRDKDGNIFGTFGVSRDITDKKIAELELIQSKQKAEESDRLKSAFLANMSHELRTPMNAVIGFTGLLKDDGFEDDEKSEFIRIIESSGQHMLNVINDIICIAELQSGRIVTKVSEFEINAFLGQIYSSYEEVASDKKLDLILENINSQETILIESDKEKLQVIISNLLNNALKFTYYGSIHFGFERQNGFLKFFVKDTGIGISNDKVDIVFDKFRQSDESLSRAFGGIGLGLAISRSYVKILGGEIWVESKKDVGSTFYFTIPTK